MQDVGAVHVVQHCAFIAPGTLRVGDILITNDGLFWMVASSQRKLSGGGGGS